MPFFKKGCVEIAPCNVGERKGAKGSFFTGLVRYAVSFATVVPGARDVSNLFAPTLNIALPSQWFVTFYPSADVRYNFGDPITGRLDDCFCRSISWSGET